MNNKIIINLSKIGEEIKVRRLKRVTDTVLDICYVVNLLAPKTKCFVDLAIIAEDKAEVTVDVKIVIAKEATEAEAVVTIKELLLSESAKVTVMPYLEVKNQTAKARHSLSTITLSQETEFYAKSRGLSSSNIKELLVAEVKNKYEC